MLSLDPLALSMSRESDNDAPIVEGAAETSGERTRRPSALRRARKQLWWFVAGLLSQLGIAASVTTMSYARMDPVHAPLGYRFSPPGNAVVSYTGIARFRPPEWDSNYAIPLGSREYAIRVSPPSWMVLGELRSFLLLGFGCNEAERAHLDAFDSPGWSLASWTKPASTRLPDQSTADRKRITEIASGFPLRSLYGRVEEKGETASALGQPLRFGAPDHRWAYRLPNTSSMPDHRFLPLRPLILGSLGNAAVYSFAFQVIWWVLMRIEHRFLGGRGRAWAKRGCCRRCGYPLGNATHCPECGRQTRRSRATPATDT